MRELIFQKELTLINQLNQNNAWCHYWHFKDICYTFESHVCNKYHDISMMAYELENIAILNVKGVDYRCVLWNDKSTLWIWILVQIKHLLQ